MEVGHYVNDDYIKSATGNVLSQHQVDEIKSYTRAQYAALIALDCPPGSGLKMTDLKLVVSVGYQLYEPPIAVMKHAEQLLVRNECEEFKRYLRTWRSRFTADYFREEARKLGVVLPAAAFNRYAESAQRAVDDYSYADCPPKTGVSAVPEYLRQFIVTDPCEQPGGGGSSPAPVSTPRYADDEREHRAWTARLGRDLRVLDAHAQFGSRPSLGTRFFECARSTFAITGDFGIGTHTAQPTDFFVLRNPVTGLELRGVFRPDANTRFVAGGGRVSFDLPRGAFASDFFRTNVTLFAGTGSGSTSVNFGTIDPQGELLGITGTGDPNALFPEGVLLGAGVPLGQPGGFNILTNGFYRRDINFTTVGGEMAFHSYYGLYEDVLRRQGIGAYVTPIIGVAATRSEVQETTTFRINGFLTDGAYNSNYVNDAFTAYGGARFDFPFRASPNVMITPFVRGSLGATFNHLDGWDRLDLSGFINDQQRVAVSANDTGLHVDLRGGVNVAVGKMCFGVSVSYTRDENYASFFRSGLTGETTQAQFNESEAIVGRFSARYAFGAPVQPIQDTAAFATCP